MCRSSVCGFVCVCVKNCPPHHTPFSLLLTGQMKCDRALKQDQSSRSWLQTHRVGGWMGILCRHRLIAGLRWWLVTMARVWVGGWTRPLLRSDWMWRAGTDSTEATVGYSENCDTLTFKTREDFPIQRQPFIIEALKVLKLFSLFLHRVVDSSWASWCDCSSTNCWEHRQQSNEIKLVRSLFDRKDQNKTLAMGYGGECCSVVSSLWSYSFL